MRILITGAAGYIGSLLTNALKKNHDITTVDSLLYNQGILTYEALRGTDFYRHDVDNLPGPVWDNAEIIIPLAAYVGVHCCDNNPKEAKRVNLHSIEKMVEKLRKDQLVIYPNTNSSYGSVKNKVCTEETETNAISHYAKLKDKAEAVILSHANSIVFRLATLFGVNPYRYRIDLLVNSLVYEAVFNDEIGLFDSEFHRNYISIHDVVRSFEFSIKNADKMRGSVYNVGNDSLNTTKMGVAKIIQNRLPNTTIKKIWGNDPDKRDYSVSSQKIYNLGFKPWYDFRQGINELIDYYRILPKDKYDRDDLMKIIRNDRLVAN